MYGSKDPDHDPYQNVTDPEHWSKLKRTVVTARIKVPIFAVMGVNAYPDPAFYLNAGPDPDPDSGSQTGSGSWSNLLLERL